MTAQHHTSQTPQASALSTPTETRTATRMTRKQLLDSFPASIPLAEGEEPFKDLPVGGRRQHRAPPPSEHERQLLSALQVWMKWPKKQLYRDRVTSLMDAHEARAYLAATK